MSQQAAADLAYPLLSELLREQAASIPTRTAMIFRGRETTYGVLDARASQVANALIDAGVEQRSRIAYLGKNSDLYFELLFGAVRAGAVFVPLNWRLAPPEVAYVLQDSESVLVFVEKDFLPVVTQVRDKLPVLRDVIVMDGPTEGFTDFESFRDQQSARDPHTPVGKNDPVLQMYTSGTTGNPKGVMLSNIGISALRVTEGQDGDWAVWGPHEMCLVSMPVFHVSGTCFAIWGFHAGATNVVLPQADADAIVDAIVNHRITKLLIVPALIQMILERPDIGEIDLTSVKTLYYGASPISPDLLARSLAVFGCDFVQLYGMTETSGTIVHLGPDQHDVKGTPRMASCGRAVAGVELRIVDEAGQILPPGEIGEIVIRTPTIMLGYWRKDDATQEVLRDGWYYSGDAGYLDEDGYLYICDRIKDMIVSGGENVYPAEVEKALQSHPAVREVAVIGVPDQKWGEAVKAVVAFKPGMTATADELTAHARKLIAGYKLPKSYDFVESLPRNAAGKILRRELRKPYWEGRERQVS